MACLICGEEIDRDRQPWRALEVFRWTADGSWEAQAKELTPDHPDYGKRQDELDPYPVHLVCLRRVIAPAYREHLVFQKPSR